MRRFFLRRRFIVDPKFQLSVVCYLLGAFAFCGLVMSVILFAPLLVSVQDTGSTVDPEAPSAATALLHLHHHYWWALLACGVVVALVALRLSHRVAGPLVRVRRALRSLAQGEIPRAFQPRRKDFLIPEIALLNDATRALNSRIADLQEKARAACRDAEHCADPSCSDDRGEIAARLLDRVRQLHDELGEFRLP